MKTIIRKQARIIRKTHKIVKNRLTHAAEVNKRNYDKRAKAPSLKVGDRVLLKQAADTGRHKLSDKFKEELFVVVQCDADQSVFLIRPAIGGDCKRVNRKMLILDPRRDVDLPQGGDPGLIPESYPESDGNQSGESDGDFVLTLPTESFFKEVKSKPHRRNSRNRCRQTQSSKAGVQDDSSPDTQGPRRSRRLQQKRGTEVGTGAVT